MCFVWYKWKFEVECAGWTLGVWCVCGVVRV